MAVNSRHPSPWLVPLQDPSNPRRTVVCFPSAGASASAFKALAAKLPDDTSVLAVQPPGRQKRAHEAPLESLAAVMEQLFPVLAALPDREIIFYGDCSGALVAYEYCVTAMKQHANLPRGFLVTCCRAPHLPPSHKLIHNLDQDGIVETLRANKLLPDWILSDEETCQFFLPLIRSDFTVAETYLRPTGVRLPLRVSALAGDSDPVTPSGDVADWERCVNAEFSFEMVHGGHDLLTTHLNQVVDKLIGV